MKRTLIFILLFIGSATLMAQNRVMPNRAYSILNSNPGYITINELQAGLGLGNTNVPYSKSMFGFTTIHGYQMNKSFLAAGGTGALFYNGGMLIPLYMDFRYNFKISSFSPYAYSDGGVLLNTSDLTEGSKIFINAGGGVRYSFSRQVAATVSAGYWVQNGVSRDSFIVVKAGVTFRPGR
ncbi:MAG TPA: hypothetical protein VMV47_06005 [Bacteroidales bacterium]|nr:hypothetical protein [Bacteroidales bacterium]